MLAYHFDLNVINMLKMFVVVWICFKWLCCLRDSVLYYIALYLQSCASWLAKHSLKRQCIVRQKLSRRDFGEANRQLVSGTLSGSSVKLSKMSWISSGSSCWNTWTHRRKMNTQLSEWQNGNGFIMCRKTKKAEKQDWWPTHYFFLHLWPFYILKKQCF